VQKIAKKWKTMLKHSDAELGIDGEFTRPAVLAKLEQIREQVEDASRSWVTYKFDFI
jgi:hypothetical protein